MPDAELRADFHIFGKQGEAAGTAAYLCLAGNQALSALDGKRVRECLKQGGSALSLCICKSGTKEEFFFRAACLPVKLLAVLCRHIALRSWQNASFLWLNR